MKTPKLIVCVRHAESARNKLKAEGPFYFEDEATRSKAVGTPDHLVPITDFGHQHARRTGKVIRHDHGVFDVVIHSGYTRTIQTMEAILEAYTKEQVKRMKVVQSILIRERESGYAFNMTKAEIDQHFSWMKDYWKETGPLFARPVGGESMVDVVEKRIIPFLNEVNQNYAGKKVLLVLHGRTLSAVRFVLENWSYDEMEKFIHGRSPQNCGQTIYEHNKLLQSLRLKDYNVCCE
jgi:broad specificity phosphatase PhoE